MKRLVKRWMVLAALAAPLATAAAGSLTAGRVQEQGTPPTEIFLHGIVQAKRQAMLSSEIAARLRSIAIEEGAEVAEGDVVAQFEDEVARASMEAARIKASANANITHARADVRVAAQMLERLRRAVERGASKESAIEEAEARLSQAEASLRSAKEELAQARANFALEKAKLEQYTIRAPFAGTIARILIDPGSTATPAQELMHLVDLSLLDVELYLPMSLFGKLKVGDSYELRAAAPVSATIGAKLIYVDPVLDSATRHMRCVFEIENEDGGLPVGFTVELERGEL